MGKKQRTKGEHKIPDKSYLDYFKSDTGKLCVYDDRNKLVKDPGNTIPREIPPVAFLKEINFYESPLFRVNAIENTLAEIEGKYNQILIDKVLRKKAITDEEKLIISYFISSLEGRTSASKANVNGFIDQISEHFTALEKQFNEGKVTPNHLELLKLKEENTAFSRSVVTAIDVNRWRLSDFLFLSIEYEDDELYFVTSDHPVTLYDFTLMNNIYGIPPLSVTAEVVVPLTTKVAIFVNNVGISGYKPVQPNFVREINNRALSNSYKYVVSAKKISKKFVDYTLKRFRQSLILEYSSDDLSDKFEGRHAKK